MWGSLFILPLLALGAIVALFHLDSQRLRRSLQFAIILSLAIHLMILVTASVINIFQNPYKPNERQVAQQKQVRTIEVSDRRAAFVWEEPNSRNTPEPTVEPEREERPTTTNLKPQTIPLKETTPEIAPQIVRRETTAQSIPKQNPELSQLRSQPREAVQPSSSQKAIGKQTAKASKTPDSTKPNIEFESSKQANTVSRQPAQSTPQPEPSTSKSSAAPDQVVKPEPTATASARRATQSKKPIEAAPKASSSQARVRRATPDLPKATAKTTATRKIASASTTQRSQAQPSKAASQLTRRPTQSRTTKPATTNKPKIELSPKPQIARSNKSVKPNLVQPSISTQTSVTMSPRRAVTDAKVAASPVQIEKPARQPESRTATRELNSKTLSVTKSTDGIAGVGRSKNLDRFTGGANSPAVRASDSARRERTLSKSQSARMLSASQQSQVRRTVGATRIPKSAFKSDTTSAAKVAGAKTAGERTMESSAARIDSRTVMTRDQMSAEKGSSTVDMGTTKVVMESQTRRRSGGGQPEVSKLDPDSTRRSRDTSNVQPALVATVGSATIAPRERSSMTPATEATEASEAASFAARAGGESSITAERGSSELPGEYSNKGDSDSAQQFAEQRQRASRNEDVTSWDADEEDDEDEENLRGTRDTRIARALVINSDPGFGLARADGKSAVKPAEAGDSPTESLATKIQRQATSSVPGTGLGQTAANALLSAATSLPIIESNSSRREGSGKQKSVSIDPTNGLANNPSNNRSTPTDLAPTATGTASLTPSESGATINSTPNASGVESALVSVERSEFDSMEREQGSRIELDAIEGPAGLGMRPDNYVGVMARPASEDSKQLQPDFKNRFRNRDFGGMPAVNPDAVIAKKAFQNRSPEAMSAVAEPTTEAAIQLGLEFLARYQSPDGSWSLTGFDRDAPQHMTQLDSDTAATGLALLAFQGAGYNHKEFKYARQIDHAIQWLIENQSDDGGLYVPTDNKSDNACRLYSHGIAALALTEAYGMTQDHRVKVAAQRALDYIANSQDSRKGGWRYFDKPGRKSTDTSVSGWMLMALQSGRLAGLDVKDECFDGVDDWLEVAADPNNQSLYRYNPYAVDSKGVSRIQGRKPTPTMTSVGLLMRIYSGWKRRDPRLIAGADYLLETLPSDATKQERDTYYWYYATQVLRHVGGSRWEKWNNELRPLLTRSQEKSGDFAGSWHPYKPVPDRWGAFGGRIYVTTMNLLSLEVRHRMLPLYQQSGPPVIAGVIETIPAKPNSTQNISTTTKPDPTPTKKLVTKKPVINEPESKTRRDLDPGNKNSKSNIPQPPIPNVSISRPVTPNTIPSRVAADETPKLLSVPKMKPSKTAALPKTEPAPSTLAPKANLSLKPKPSPKKPTTVPKLESELPIAVKPKPQPPSVSPLLEPAKPVSKFGTVSGRITLESKLLTNAKVEFIPVDQQSESVIVRTDQNGNYVFPSLIDRSVKGLKAGTYRVAITTYVESEDENVIDLLETVPEKYNSKTTLSATVVAGKTNKLNFDLEP